MLLRHLIPLLLVAVAGCAADPPPAPLPKVRDLRPRVAAPAPETQPFEAVALAHVLRIDYPLGADLEEAWKLVSAGAIAPAEAAAWGENFLRVGVVPARRLPQFEEALPVPLGVERERVYAAPRLMPLPYTPPLRGPAAVEVALPPFAPQAVTFNTGRLQFLLRVRPEGRGAAVELIPHHHEPKVTIQPREPWEKELDGRIYEELAVRARVQPEEALVVGLPAIPQVVKRSYVIPATPASQPAPGGSGPAAPAPAAPGAVATPPTEPQLPAKLGTLLLAGTRHQKPLQLLLVIRVGPIPSSKDLQGHH